MNNNNNNNNNDPPTRHQDSFTNGRSPLHYQRTPVSSWQQYPVSAEEQRDESLRNLSSARQPQTQTAWESRRSTSVPSPIRRGTGDATLSSFRQSPQRLPAALPRSTRKEVLLAPRASAEDEAAVLAELLEFERLRPIVENTVKFPPRSAGEDNERTEATRAAHPRTESAQAELQLSPVIRTPASSRSTEGSPRQPISTAAAAAAAAAHSVTEERNYEEPVRRRSPADGEAAASAPMSIPIATNRFHVTDEDEGEEEEDEGNEPTLPTTTATPNHHFNSVNAVSLPLQSRGEGSTTRPPPILPPVKLPPARRHFCTIVLHFLQFESTSPLSLKDPKQFIAGLLDAAAATATDHHLPAQDAVSVKVRQHCFARLPITNDESASKNWEALLKEIELVLPFLVDVDAIVVQEITSASPSLTEHQQQVAVSGQSVDETPLNTARTSVDRWWSVVYKQPPPQSSFFHPSAPSPSPAAGSNRPRISNNNNSPRRHLPSQQQQQQSVGMGTKIVISVDRRLRKDIVQVARDSLSSLRTMLFLFDESSMTFRYTVDLFDKQYQRYCEKLRDATKTPSSKDSNDPQNSNNPQKPLPQVMGIMDVCGQVPCFDFLCPSSTGEETVTKAINRAGQQWMELEGLSQVFSSTHPTPLTKKEERGTATRVTSSNNAPANKVQNNNNNSNNRSSRGSTPRGRGRSPSLERSDSSSSAPSSSLSSKIQSFQALLRDQCPLLMKPDTNCPIRHYCSNNCDEEFSTIRGHHQQHDDASTAADTKDQGSAWVRSHKALWTAVSSSSSSPCFPTVCTEITSSSLRPSANRNGGDGALTMAQMLTVVLRRGLRVC